MMKGDLVVLKTELEACFKEVGPGLTYPRYHSLLYKAVFAAFSPGSLEVLVAGVRQVPLDALCLLEVRT